MTDAPRFSHVSLFLYVSYLKIAIDKSITPLKILLVFDILSVSANHKRISATNIAINNVFSLISTDLLVRYALIILYTIS